MDDFLDDKPRYVQRFKRGNKVYYRYNPPQYAVDAGIVERCMLDKQKLRAYAQAEKFNAKLDEWRAEKMGEFAILKRDKTFNGLVQLFKSSGEYANLSDTTKQQYEYWLRIAESYLQHHTDYNQIPNAEAIAVYASIADTNGVVLANRVIAVCRRLFSYGIRMDLVSNNPWRQVKTRTEHSRRTIWTKQQVYQFLEAAYSEWETRSIGLIAQMCYEWCQRVGDMRLLTWDAINFEEGYVKLVQSKRRAQVKIPISEPLLQMLKEQNGALDFQPLVAPNVADKMKPFNVHRISGWVNKVKQKAGLPDELRLADLRRTGTTEMVEAGVPLPQIMAVTGHNTPNSVTPYMKNSLTSATQACTLRSSHGR